MLQLPVKSLLASLKAGEVYVACTNIIGVSDGNKLDIQADQALNQAFQDKTKRA